MRESAVSGGNGCEIGEKAPLPVGAALSSVFKSRKGASGAEFPKRSSGKELPEVSSGKKASGRKAKEGASGAALPGRKAQSGAFGKAAQEMRLRRPLVFTWFR